jgi:hypothetical protein
MNELGCLEAVEVAVVAIVGLAALAVAEFNLLGVPMLEPSAMNPGLGWMALATAVVCFVRVRIVMYRNKPPKE